MLKTKIGIIGGSGIYDIANVKDGMWIDVSTPYGDPSDQIFKGKLDGIEIYFLPRHGRGHIHNPSNVPYRANIFALKSLGVTDVISFSACGSLNDKFKPGDFVIVDQFIDRTFKREKTFFSDGCVAHVSLAKPVCNRLGALCQNVMEDLKLDYHVGGTYLAMEGPQFSTLAESLLYKNVWGCDVIGMTNMPEAKLIREAEMCYSPIAMVTDYDCWHPNHDNVEVSDIIHTLSKNVILAKSVITNLIKSINEDRDICPGKCDRALEYAIITEKSKITEIEKTRLSLLTNRIFNL